MGVFPPSHVILGGYSNVQSYIVHGNSASCLHDSSNSIKKKRKCEHLKCTNGVAPNGVLRGCENPIDQLGWFSLAASLHDRTHRFCGFFVSHYYCASNDLCTMQMVELEEVVVRYHDEDIDDDYDDIEVDYDNYDNYYGDYVVDDDSRKWLK